MLSNFAGLKLGGWMESSPQHEKAAWNRRQKSYIMKRVTGCVKSNMHYLCTEQLQASINYKMCPLVYKTVLYNEPKYRKTRVIDWPTTGSHSTSTWIRFGVPKYILRHYGSDAIEHIIKYSNKLSNILLNLNTEILKYQSITSHRLELFLALIYININPSSRFKFSSRFLLKGQT